MAAELETNTDSKRKLASIQIVSDIEKHTNADSLELSTVLGWQIITRIGETEKGKKIIYCEIDSKLPIKASWLPDGVKAKILRDHKKKWFRIRTQKIRGEISYGLIIPFTDNLPLPSGVDVPPIDWYSSLEIGTDVTRLLGIAKYEPPSFTGRYSLYASKIGDTFPTHLLSKTDEGRLQSEPHLLKNLHGLPYYISVKMDGTSVTYLINPTNDEFLVCSRNFIRKRPEKIETCPYWEVAIKYDIENKLRKFPHLAIQGEILAPNIQKNLCELKDIQLNVFNMIDLRDRSYLSIDNMIEMCKTLDISHVPIEERADSFQYDNIKVLVKKAEGNYPKTSNPREGLVIRSLDSSISFKVINVDYLLRNNM